MTLKPWFAAYWLLWLFVCLCLPANASEAGEIKVSFAFRHSNVIDCQMALTRDSIGILKVDSTAGSLEPDDENGFAEAEIKRELSPEERETADILISLTNRWKGLKRYTCEKDDGYAFSLWSDSLALHCNNCFSCSDGVDLQDAKILAKFGKLTLWMYKLREGML